MIEIAILLGICFAVVLALSIKRKSKELLKTGLYGIAFSVALSESDLVVSQLQLPAIAMVIILGLLLFSAIYLVIR